ncbi:MAG: sensor histidine kinase, partial [Lachnospiraceae bacterium]|nr:sensor histidine kinase [Lachnospiraceae bacterium]
GRELSNGLWSIYSLISVDQINATASGTLVVNCLILFSSVALMLLLLFWASVGMTRPIARLSAGMQEIRNGNLNVRVQPEETKDENGLLIDHFNLMAATMNEMNEKIYEKQRNLQKAEMKALQAQINPHFLYNSLDSVVWLLRLNRKEEAITMLGAMTKLFKAVLSKGKEYIPVADEICHVENYLFIQKIRYRNKFCYEVNVEEGVKQYRTIKLLLQPLVENAIYHGIREDVESEEITVSAYERETEILFQVADTGKGMDETELQALRENVKMLRETTEGYGLKNIYERLQIYYAGRAEMTIDSQSDRGTVITIRIPKENVGI